MCNAGSAGLTADRLGDEEKWVPVEEKVSRDSISTLTTKTTTYDENVQETKMREA
jgi:hypothetical protein